MMILTKTSRFQLSSNTIIKTANIAAKRGKVF